MSNFSWIFCWGNLFLTVLKCFNEWLKQKISVNHILWKFKWKNIPYSAVLLRDWISNKDFFIFLLFCKEDGSVCPLSFKAFNGVQEGFACRFEGKWLGIGYRAEFLFQINSVIFFQTVPHLIYGWGIFLALCGFFSIDKFIHMNFYDFCVVTTLRGFLSSTLLQWLSMCSSILV